MTAYRFALILTALALTVTSPSVAELGAPWDDAADLMADSRSTRRAAIDSLVAAEAKGAVPGIVDSLFFIPRHSRDEAFDALAKLTGAEVDDKYYDWIEWVGKSDIEPAEGYMAFKRTLLQRIDRRFGAIFYDGAPMKIRFEEVVSGGVGLEGIPTLENPPHVPADHKDARYMRDNELVFGVAVDGVARAYPVRILSWHEMLNDVVGEQPVTLSYCTLCGSGIVYDTRTPNGGAYTFGTSGLLYRSNKLMVDRQTYSLWSNLTGRAVIGRAATGERRLPMLPATLTTWESWLATHPDTTVLTLPEDGQYRFDYRPGAADRARRGVKFPVPVQNDALERNDEVYALETADGALKAWALEPLYKEGLLHDTVGVTPLVLVADAEGQAVRAYQRAAEQTFERQETSLVDGSGVTWRIAEDALSTEGGERLERVPGHVAFWFGWYAFFPQTELWSGE
ncbi:MAG: DUF3179 domain-containing protein [Acidobacteriota bacterium]